MVKRLPQYVLLLFSVQRRVLKYLKQELLLRLFNLQKEFIDLQYLTYDVPEDEDLGRKTVSVY